MKKKEKLKKSVTILMKKKNETKKNHKKCQIPEFLELFDIVGKKILGQF